jgi:hypothetical protein
MSNFTKSTAESPALRGALLPKLISGEIRVKPLQNPQRHHRRSIRLRGYDYSQVGAYFVTVCVQGRECLFGDVLDGQMRLNNLGNIIRDEWIRTGDMRSNVELDAFVVMPNHFHAIVVLSQYEHCRGDRPVAPTIAPITGRTMAYLTESEIETDAEPIAGRHL